MKQGSIYVTDGNEEDDVIEIKREHEAPTDPRLSVSFDTPDLSESKRAIDVPNPADLAAGDANAVPPSTNLTEGTPANFNFAPLADVTNIGAPMKDCQCKIALADSYPDMSAIFDDVTAPVESGVFDTTSTAAHSMPADADTINAMGAKGKRGLLLDQGCARIPKRAKAGSLDVTVKVQDRGHVVKANVLSRRKRVKMCVKGAYAAGNAVLKRPISGIPMWWDWDTMAMVCYVFSHRQYLRQMHLVRDIAASLHKDVNAPDNFKFTEEMRGDCLVELMEDTLTGRHFLVVEGDIVTLRKLCQENLLTCRVALALSMTMAQ
mmetsp:Transcript_41874/g.97672  ORF Transcript_41874/g.97672 Transcript_41874/m.97672 type:complete len:320 (-) Transcript_41874:237-1196(-)